MPANPNPFAPLERDDAASVPMAVSSEMAVLGAALLDNAALDDLAALLPSDFATDGHRAVYERMLAAHRAGRPFDALSLAEELKGDRRLGQEIVEAPVSYLSHLVDVALQGRKTAYHAALIAKKARLRRLAFDAVELAREALDADADPDELAGRVSQLADRTATTSAGDGPRLIGEIAFEALSHYERRAAGEIPPGLPTGLVDVDDILGGLQRTDLVTIAARPAMGKSALGAQIADHVAKLGGTSLYFAAEMSARQLAERTLAGHAGVDFFDLRHARLSPGDYRKVADVFADLQPRRFFVDDALDCSPSDIRAKARRIKRDYELDLIVVDYLQLMTSRGLYRPSERVREVGYFTRELKKTAKELDVPVIALSQLSRSCESRADKRPVLSDLRESGDIEQDSDVVAFLYRPEVYDDIEENRGKAELIVRKQRNGPTGTVHLTFLGERVRFADAHREW